MESVRGVEGVKAVYPFLYGIALGNAFVALLWSEHNLGWAAATAGCATGCLFLLRDRVQALIPTDIGFWRKKCVAS